MKLFGCIVIMVIFPTIKGNLQFWYINDINYDPTYNTTAESCTGDVTERDPIGDYECDAPWEMVESAVRKMAYTFGTPEFIVWGGANAFHVNETNTIFTEDLMLEIMTNITNLFRTQFPGIQVLPVLGNHDWWPKSQLPADGDTSDNDLYDKYYELWKDWIPQEHEQTFKKAGYYAMSLSNDRLTAIVINSDLYLDENEAVTGSDPGGQFLWLEQQLGAARQEKRKVHIISHAPVGSLQSDYNNKLADVIRDFSDVIIAVHGGYEMTDQFRLIYDQDGKAVSFVLVAPSLSPRIGPDSFPRNPAFRTYTFDLNGGGIFDSEQYYLNLASEKKDWEPLYRYSHFGMVHVNATNMQNLLNKMKQFGSQEFHDYHRFKYVDIGWPYYQACSCKCKFTEICAIENVDRALYRKCVEEVSLTCGADQKYYSVVLMFVVFVISKIIHL